MKIISLLLFVLSFNIFANDVKYSEALDVLLYLDGLAGVDQNDIYKTSIEDQKLLSEFQSDLQIYANMRNRLKRKQELDSPVWGKLTLERDLLIPLFAESKSVEEALKRSVGLFQKDEKKNLEQLLLKMKPLLTPQISQSFAHQKMMTFLKKNLNKSGFFKKVEQAIKLLALQADRRQKVTLFLAWNHIDHPPEVQSFGPYTLLKIHPTKVKDLEDFDDILFKIFVQYPGYLSESAQQNINLAFKDHCSFPRALDRGEMLAKPLAYALSRLDPKGKLVHLNRSQTISPWIEVYAQMMIPALMQDIKEKRNIFTGQWIPRAVKSCDELLSLSQFLTAVR
ncbi:MAG: hypothetical protein Fur0010_26090 [Bdellovibrio sp.]